MLSENKKVYELLRCPITGGELELVDNSLVCIHSNQKYVYDILYGFPVLIDFNSSILKNDFKDSLSSVIKRNTYNGVFKLAKNLLASPQKATHQNVSEIIKLMFCESDQPNVLIVGGGTMGQGMDIFYYDPRINLISFDIYASSNIQFLADAHKIPLLSNFFDVVIVQAVLEHVLEPQTVVNEIHRVLRSNGILYAETPFLQGVHEGAYDFTRFTESGHRYLFRYFKIIKSGVCAGAGTQLLWSLEYFIKGLFRSTVIGKISKVLLFWLKYFDFLIPNKYNINSASGVYFLGRKVAEPICPKDMVNHFKGVS